MTQAVAPDQFRPAIGEAGVVAGAAAIVLGALLWFYGSRYSLHQDLAGSVLSGRLSVTLGDDFGKYSLYFPPAERVWFSLAVRLGDLTGIGADRAIVAMTGSAVLFAAGLAWQIRRLTTGAGPKFFVASVVVLIVAPILFKNIFGLREHLVVLGLWPYLVLRVSDPDAAHIGKRLRALVGLWLGGMLLFKYLYSLLVALVEVVDALMQRRPNLLLRVESLAAGAIVFLYLLLWLGVDPGQRQAVAAMVSAVDAALADPAENVLKVAENLVLAGAFLLLLRTSRVPARLVGLAFVTILGTVTVAFLQERWFSHHLFPIFMAYAFWWWATAAYLRRWHHAVLAASLIYAGLGQFLATAQYHEQVEELDEAFQEAGLSVRGKRVGLLNLHPSPYNQYLASNGGSRWNPLMNIAYVSAELAPLDRPENAGRRLPPVRLGDPGRKLLHDQMLGLWEDDPPDALILDYSIRWPLRHINVDWIQAFSNDPRFNTILSHYRPVLLHQGKRLKFTYYVRRQSDAGAVR
jgi:hypothetical protein